MSKINKKLKVILILGGALVLMVAAIPAAIWVTHTQTAELGNSRVRCQRSEHSSHVVIIQNNQAVPQHTDAKKCDTLTITNLDPREQLMAFGPHEKHISYDGVSERLLSHGQSLTITLIQTGTFSFHDHLRDLAVGTFTVK